MIHTIISGGQSGADQAGLRAGRKLGLKVGGFCPKGFKTEHGNLKWLGPTYNLVETESEDYRERTELNVLTSHGTVIFGISSPGSRLTQTLCMEAGAPWLWLHGFTSVPEVAVKAPEFRRWVAEHHIQVLNVAGNRESKWPGIGLAVERFLVSAIPTCK